MIIAWRPQGEGSKPCYRTRLQNNVTDGLVTNELVTNGLPSEALAQDGGGRGTSYILRTSEVEILFRAVTG
ncbi:MAG: hypothetical protein IH846_04120 [Acidobacteria bacterium]|nr:hypothetical protein [Acidobacteriota bacterium]